MNAPLHLPYNNEVSAEFLRLQDDSPFTQHQIAGFSEQTLAIIQQQEAYAKAHPPLGIYRLATEGSQTRNGGVIQQATSLMEITLHNGQQVRVAQQGDHAVYADGSTAQIVTGAGQENNHFALVGSQLSNGDEIIDTPQDRVYFVARDGVAMAEDFLPTVEG